PAGQHARVHRLDRGGHGGEPRRRRPFGLRGHRATPRPVPRLLAEGRLPARLPDRPRPRRAGRRPTLLRAPHHRASLRRMSPTKENADFTIGLDDSGVLLYAGGATGLVLLDGTGEQAVFWTGLAEHAEDQGLSALAFTEPVIDDPAA